MFPSKTSDYVDATLKFVSHLRNYYVILFGGILKEFKISFNLTNASY